jgi:glucans biosynthesis protein C
MTDLKPGAASAEPSRLPGTDRLHGLDTLRGIALLLGLVVHASLAFLPGGEHFWVVADPNPSALLGLAFYVPHMFRMILFFLIAGFFGRLACERLGMKAFARDRFRRIFLVLLAFWPIVFTGIVVAIIIIAVHANGGTLPPEPSDGPAFTSSDFPLTHLWFLYVLTLCYAAMLAGRWLLAALDRQARLSYLADQFVRLFTKPIGPALLALPLATALALTAHWLIWFGIPTPDTSFYPNLAACTAYGSAFIIGWWLHRQQALLVRWTRHWLLHFAVALAATVTCLSLVGLTPSATPASPGMLTWSYAYFYALGAWSWTAALTGLALRFLDRPSTARRYLADASYWIYLMHLPLVMILQAYAIRLPGPAALKFAAIVALTLLLLLGCYRLFVRRTALGAFINGRRRN